MSDATENSSPAEARNQLFAAPPPERSPFPKTAVIAALAAVVVVVAALVLMSRGHKTVPAGTILPLDPAASTLALSDLAMSESSSLSGGKSTFIDGHIRNTGSKTVTGVDVQVLFRNDEALPPQVETLPLSLIRAREPYIDTQPVAAAPIAPNEDREFRLIFENINSNWNVQIPEIHITHIATK